MSEFLSHLWQLTPWWILDIPLRLALAGLVVARRRSVPVTLAWLVMVLALPIVGIVVYLLVGESRLGRRRLAEYRQVTTEVEPPAVARWWERGLTVSSREGAAEPALPHAVDAHVARFASAVGGLPPMRGNGLTLIGDTDEMLRRLIADIDAATSHCHLLYYIWMDGGLAEQVCGALVRACQRGVECKVLVDDVGSSEFVSSPEAEELRRAGVRLVGALPANPIRALFARLDLRNHRKIAVVDGRIAYCGSQNLTDTTFHFKKRGDMGPWIDATVRLEGPAAQALALVFLRDWAMEVEEKIELSDRYFPSVEPGDGAVVQVVPTGPGPEQGAIRDAMLTLIYAAREELVLTNPYFVPDDAMMAAITSAARRGVRVTLVVPRVADARIVTFASRWHYQELLAAGVRIMHHREGLLHAKIITADGRLAMIGSANLDMRSFWLNFEATLIVYDAAFTRELRALQRQYIEASDAIEPAQWSERPMIGRVVESIARLAGPLL